MLLQIVTLWISAYKAKNELQAKTFLSVATIFFYCLTFCKASFRWFPSDRHRRGHPSPRTELPQGAHRALGDRAASGEFSRAEGNVPAGYPASDMYFNFWPWWCHFLPSIFTVNLATCGYYAIQSNALLYRNVFLPPLAAIVIHVILL